MMFDIDTTKQQHILEIPSGTELIGVCAIGGYDTYANVTMTWGEMNHGDFYTYVGSSEVVYTEPKSQSLTIYPNIDCCRYLKLVIHSKPSLFRLYFKKS